MASLANGVTGGDRVVKTSTNLDDEVRNEPVATQDDSPVQQRLALNFHDEVVAPVTPPEDTAPSDPQASKADALFFTRPQIAHATQLYSRWQKLPEAYKKRVEETLRAESPVRLAMLKKALDTFEQGSIEVNGNDAKPLSISELQEKAGWADGSWQVELLRAMDGAGRFERDGKITAAELVTGVRNPEDPQFLSTSMLERLESLINNGDTAHTQEVLAAVQKEWEQAFLKRAGENKGETLDIEALKKLVESNKERLAMQNLTVLFHEIASFTGEPDPFRIGGLDSKHVGVVRSSYAGAFDTRRLVATVIAQVVSADDINQKGKVSRKNRFFADAELAESEWQVAKDDYKKTGYDRGHLASSADAANHENMLASFSMLNMTPQTPQLNRFAWRYLEHGIRELIADTGGRAVVYTGSLFVDDAGNPLPDDKIDKIGDKGREVHVPSHLFKAVLFELPDGEVTAMAFRLPNSRDIPTKLADIKELMAESRISVAELEKQAGVKLFDEILPPHIKQNLLDDKVGTVPVNDPENFGAKLLWREPNPVTSWVGFPSYRVDAELEALDRLIRAHMQLAQEDAVQSVDMDPADLFAVRQTEALHNRILSESELRIQLAIANREDVTDDHLRRMAAHVGTIDDPNEKIRSASAKPLWEQLNERLGRLPKKKSPNQAKGAKKAS